MPPRSLGSPCCCLPELGQGHASLLEVAPAQTIGQQGQGSCRWQLPMNNKNDSPREEPGDQTGAGLWEPQGRAGLLPFLQGCGQFLQRICCCQEQAVASLELRVSGSLFAELASQQPEQLVVIMPCSFRGSCWLRSVCWAWLHTGCWA